MAGPSPRLGVDDFLVFSNDCERWHRSDAGQVGADGLLTHVRNDGPYDKGGIQFTALKAAAKMDQVQQADWILPLDVDEFVNIHTGDHTLAALHAALPEATAITLTWRLFGNRDRSAIRQPRHRHLYQMRACGDALAVARRDVQNAVSQ